MKKMLERDSFFSQTLSQTEQKIQYDEAVKKVLANKWVLAHILKGCVEEYEKCSIEEIAQKYIEGKPEIGKIGLHKDETNRLQSEVGQIEGMSLEDNSQTEGKVFFDIRFRTIAPGSDDGSEIRLIINIEAQNKYYPGYSIEKRGIYYGSRMISAQYGTVFHHAEYEKIQKVYSIWICTNPPTELKNTITKYQIQSKPLVGDYVPHREKYDLMTLVTICLDTETVSTTSDLLGFLDVLLSVEKTVSEKRDILTNDYGVPMTKQFESEVEEMCNVSEGVFERGIEQGELKLSKLIEALLQSGRTEDIQKAVSDDEARKQFYREFGIID